MALVVGNGTVATGMSPVVEQGLYADEIFRDGVSFTSEHTIGNAGQIQVEVYSPDNSIEPTVPGANFSNSEYANTVVDINTNNSFKKSQKVPAYFEASMPTDVLMNSTWKVTEDVRVARQKSGLAVLVDEGTASTVTSAISDIKADILASRATLRASHARPDVCICSVDVYTMMLKAAGTDYTPVINDDVVTFGRVGYWMGILFIEATQLDGTSSYKYMQANGTTKSVNISSIQYILYDHRAFSIIDRLTLLRVKDSELFAGSLVQEEVDTGFKVTNDDAVLVRSKNQ